MLPARHSDTFPLPCKICVETRSVLAVHSETYSWLPQALQGDPTARESIAAHHSHPYTYNRAMHYYDGLLHLLKADHAKRYESTPSADVQHCLRRIEEKHMSVEKKSGLAIVVSIIPDRASDVEVEHATDNMKHYAERHGYTFYLVTLSNKQPHACFFTARWLDLVTSQVWKQYEWVLHLDGDSIFLDFNKSLDQYTTASQDIFLQVRLNREVTAAAVLMRTSSFAECFVRLWGGKRFAWKGKLG